MALPFAPGSVDRVVSNVALPYMNIPKTLKEVYRVLAIDGRLTASLHPCRYTISELFHSTKLQAILYRLLVLANGVLFHLFGWAPGESFQTKGGMRFRLKQTGFSYIEFRSFKKDIHLHCLWVEATKVPIKKAS
jgi:ubiquinone/menaquinone biosynthesis C-methylase UbiE